MSGLAQMIGSIPEYNSGVDDWNVYYERLEQFFEVNEVPAEKQSSFLISVIGAEAYKCLRDLCHPVLPKNKPFADLCELLRKQFCPHIAIFRERVKFYNARQENHENVTQWYGRLKRLSVDCKFGGNLESVLLDKFITGLRPGQVLDRLCEENESVKLEQALDIAVNKECAAKENAYLPYRPSLFEANQPPRVQRCFFGGQPVPNARIAVCPPAPIELRNPAFGTGGGTGTLFGSPAAGPVGDFAFGSAPAANASTGLFGSSAAAQPVERIECADIAPVAEACAFSVSKPEQPAGQEQQDGVPEGANRAGNPAAKNRRVRTRRRGAGRRDPAVDNTGDAGDQNSVNGEQT